MPPNNDCGAIRRLNNNLTGSILNYRLEAVNQDGRR